MLVARVISPISSRESWAVLGDDDTLVAPIERCLAYLTDIETLTQHGQGVCARSEGLARLSRRSWPRLASGAARRCG